MWDRLWPLKVVTCEGFQVNSPWKKLAFFILPYFAFAQEQMGEPELILFHALVTSKTCKYKVHSQAANMRESWDPRSTQSLILKKYCHWSSSSYTLQPFAVS